MDCEIDRQTGGQRDSRLCTKGSWYMDNARNPRHQREKGLTLPQTSNIVCDREWERFIRPKSYSELIGIRVAGHWTFDYSQDRTCSCRHPAWSFPSDGAHLTVFEINWLVFSSGLELCTKGKGLPQTTKLFPISRTKEEDNRSAR